MTDRIDQVLTHPVGGLLLFGLMMLLVFQAVFLGAAVDGPDRRRHRGGR